MFFFLIIAHVTHIELKRNNSKNTENKHDFHVEVIISSIILLLYLKVLFGV